MTAPDQPIKVIEVFDDRELAVNAGMNRGLTEGTILRILTGQPRKMRDPDTGEILGEVVRTKAVVRVFEVQERFALARTFRSRAVNVGGDGMGTSSFEKIFDAPRWETRVETLRRSERHGIPLDPDEAVVSKGDIAEVVSQDEADDVPSLASWR